MRAANWSTRQGRCLQHQSYKLIDSGEGGLVVTDDEELVVRCAAYSGCYEKNWLKHGWPIDPGIAVSIIRGLPVYNFRMTNLTAAVILPQLLNIEARVARYARNYFQLERHLRQSVLLRFPSFTEGTRPVLDSMQFFLNDLEPFPNAQLEREARVRGVDLACSERPRTMLAAFGIGISSTAANALVPAEYLRLLLTCASRFKWRRGMCINWASIYWRHLVQCSKAGVVGTHLQKKVKVTCRGAAWELASA